MSAVTDGDEELRVNRQWQLFELQRLQTVLRNEEDLVRSGARPVTRGMLAYQALAWRHYRANIARLEAKRMARVHELHEIARKRAAEEAPMA